jgi:non-specific serine/threonine protein kinase
LEQQFRRFALPTSPIPLLGRERELATIRHALLQNDVRLLTLTGPAGVGKTRLALEAAAQLGSAFSHGAVFVDLSPVRDPALVQAVLMQRLGLAGGGIESLLERFQEYLRDETLLLILDNFEHVLPASLGVAAQLGTCPGLKVLVTSRSPLQLQWEQIQVISPLLLPDLDHLPSLDDLAAIPSVALFLERARARQSAIELTEENSRIISELCVRLDGLPLALELAAARLNVLPPAAILDRVRSRLQVLRWEAQDLPDRHRSLHAAIDWSHALLSDAEQRLLRSCGVFVGRIAVEPMDVVVGSGDTAETLELMASLAEKSLILPDGTNGVPAPAFTVLATMSEYARERLEESGEYESAGRAHALYFLGFAERADSESQTRHQHSWPLNLESEHDNLRAALRWLLDHGEGISALRLATALGLFWWVRGYHAEGWQWLEDALQAAPDANLPLRVTGLLAAGCLLAAAGEEKRSKETLEQAYSLAQEVRDAVAIARSLTYLGMRAVNVQDWPESDRLLRDALAHWQELGDRADGFHAGSTLVLLGWATFLRGNYQEAASLLGDGLERFRAIGDHHASGHVLFHLALTVRAQGDFGRAVEHLCEGLEISLDFRDRWQLSQGVRVALLLMDDRADPEQQARLVGAADALSAFTGFSASYWRLMSGPSGVGLRERLERDGYGVAYRQGYAMSCRDTVDLIAAMLRELVSSGRAPTTSTPCTYQARSLSLREQAVLRLVSEGGSNKEIARKLSVSPATVSYHLNSIFNKLGVCTRAQAVAIGMRDKLF